MSKSVPLEEWMTALDGYDVEYNDVSKEDLAHPYHPTLRLGKRIQAGQNAANKNFLQKDFEDVLGALNVAGLVNRGKYIADYVGSCDADKNIKNIKEVMRSLTLSDKGNKVPVKVFEKKLAALKRIIFTGHPTFSMNPKTFDDLSKYFSYLAGSGNYGPDTEKNLRKSALLPYEAPDIYEEFSQMVGAAKNLHVAIEDIEIASMEVGMEEYPKSWKKINYMPAGLATWIPTDWDGRKDIKWNQLMEMRIALQIYMIEDIVARFEKLSKFSKIDDNGKLKGVIEKLRSTISIMGEHQEFYKNYDQSTDVGHQELGKWEARLVEDVQNRITHPGEMIDVIEGALKKTRNKDEQFGLVHLRSRLCNHGLTLAHSHFRTSSSSIVNALEEHFKIDSDLPANEVYDTHSSKIDKMIKAAKAKTPDMRYVATSKKPLITQMALISQFTRHIDSHSPVRFLISETHNAVVPLAALYFAKSMGIDRQINISPLLEDQIGLENGVTIIERLLKNPDYLEHLMAERPHSLQLFVEACFELGYSDSGRYIGQIPAGELIARLKVDLLKLHKKYGLGSDVNLVLFNTNGEDSGRGTHPASIEQRFAYLDTLYFLHEAKKLGIHITSEDSIQGGDGYLLFGTSDSSLAFLCKSLTHLTSNHSNVEKDIMHHQEQATSVKSFFGTVQKSQESMANDGGYIDLIATFAPLLKLGSRPGNRQYENGGEKKLPRAIPHNAALKLLGDKVNLLYGLSNAIRNNEGEYIRLMENSPEFYMRMEMAEIAIETMCDPYILKSYVELYNPAFWQERARGTNNDSDKDNFLDVAKYLRKSDHYSKFSSVAGKICQDFEYLQTTRKAFNLQKFFPRNSEYQNSLAESKANNAVLHGMRISKMMELFTTAIKIPETDESQLVRRSKLIDMIIGLDPKAPGLLNDTFETATNGKMDKSADSLSNDYITTHTEVVIPIRQCMESIAETSRTSFYMNYGVG